MVFNDGISLMRALDSGDKSLGSQAAFTRFARRVIRAGVLRPGTPATVSRARFNGLSVKALARGTMHHAPGNCKPAEAGSLIYKAATPSRKTAGLVTLRESRLKTAACEINGSSFKLLEHPPDGSAPASIRA